MKDIKGGITAVKGIKASGIKCGIKENKDLALIYSEKPAVFDAVFTTNTVKAAPVILSKIHAESKIARAIIINSGNANACTGNVGMEHAEMMVQAVADELNIQKERVMVASTGVIGIELPIKKIMDGIPRLVSSLSNEGGLDAAEAIMTTDTLPKTYAVEEERAGESFRVGGIAKGSGMLCPNMATMISVIATDAQISPKALQNAFRYAVNRTFNCISVDGCMSTNDTAMILATGQAQFGIIKEGSPDYFLFREVLTHVMLTLAKEMVRDGEGATKLILVRVEKADSFSDAEKIAHAVANSVLVKTAFFGEDINWGRIVAAAGTCGVEFSIDNMDVYIEDTLIFSGGKGVGLEAEKAAALLLKNKEITVRILLNSGSSTAEIWTTDMSYDYIKINSSYRS